jgi:Na+/glutamate symporter
MAREAMQVGYWTVIVGSTVVLGWRTLQRGADADAWKLARRVGWGIGELVLFGGGADVVHALVNTVHTSIPVNAKLVILEDGGELIVLSWICAVVVAAVQQDQLGSA